MQKKTHRQGAKGLLNQEYRTLTTLKRREASVDIPLKPGRSERADARANLPEHALNYMQRARTLRTFRGPHCTTRKKTPLVGLESPKRTADRSKPRSTARAASAAEPGYPLLRVPSSWWARSRAPTHQTTVGSSSEPEALSLRAGCVTAERSAGSSTRTTVNRPKLASPPDAGAVGRKEHW